MKPAITKEQFLENIGPKTQKSLEEQLGVDLNSDISIEEILKLIEKEQEKIKKNLEWYEKHFNKNDE